MPRRPSVRLLAPLLALLAGALLLAPPARAGGSPETTVVVANGGLPSSLEVANEYAALRHLPPGHVLVLEDVPPEPVIGVEAFRERILQPLEAWLEKEGLSDDVDTVAYSVGFPYGVNFGADAKDVKDRLSPLVRNNSIGSLTGLTYLYRRVLAKDAVGYLDMHVNGYYRRDQPGGGPKRPPTDEERKLYAEGQAAVARKDWKAGADALGKLVVSYPESYESWYNLACCLSRLGRSDDALGALEKAVEHGWSDAAHTEADPDLESLKSTPAFARLLEAMHHAPTPLQTSRGFRADVAWKGEDAPDASAPPDDPDHYRLAVMLGWTGAHGNTLDEVLGCLRRTAPADGTNPDGTVYLMVSKDRLRTGPRQPYFEPTRSLLEALGHKAEILEAGKNGENGVLPKARNDVLGIVAGVAGFRWPDDLPPMLPGAIAEHLTSFGAHFGTASQTKLTEFIRHGAAGSSGTVAEPYNNPVKFPLPYVHVHYAHGCSLAESFYQSVWMPYQLLIVGDPLARPFAHFQTVRVASPDLAKPLAGRVDIVAKTEREPGHLELWVDGRPVARAGAGGKLAWDTTKGADGWHDLRVVAVDPDPVATRSVGRWDVEVRNGDADVQVERHPDAVAYDGDVALVGTARGADAVRVLFLGQTVAEAKVFGGRWKVAFPAARLAPGPASVVVLAAKALPVGGDGEVAPVARARPLTLEVKAPHSRPATKEVAPPSLPGLDAVVADAQGKTHEGVVVGLSTGSGRRLAQDLRALGVPKPRKITLDGWFRVPEAGTWELDFGTPSEVSVKVDGGDVLERKEAAAPARAAALVGLDAGWHALTVEAAGPGADRLALVLGAVRPASDVSTSSLAHTAADLAPGDEVEGAFVGDAEKATPALVDQKRDGKGAHVDEKGVRLRWKRTEHDLEAVLVFPARGKNAPAFPAAWTVETRSSPHSSWRPVRDAETIVAPGPEVPVKGVEPVPSYVEIRFQKTSAREIRVRPSEGKSQATVTELLPLCRARHHR